MLLAVAGALVGLAASLAVGQQTPASRPADGGAPETRKPAYTHTLRVPDRLLDDRPRKVVILPSEPVEFGEDPTRRSSGAVARPGPQPHHLPEGYVLAGREARIEREGRWYVAQVTPAEDAPPAPPLRILPNQKLSMIEAILADSETGDSPRLVITGRITEFQGANYILVDILAQQAARRDAREEARANAPPEGTGDDGASAPPEGTATRPAGEPSPQDVIRHLMQERPLRSVVLPELQPVIGSQPGDAGADGAIASGPSGLYPEETLLIDRVGRILPGDPWWQLSFEDMGLRPKDKPIPLLPNRMLETAVALSGGGTKGITFIVSGELTVHDGRNYLLLRKVLIQRDFGNLR